MAKLQRVVSESESEKELIEKMSDLSDDEGPEEVTFDDSKVVALKSVKDARDAVKRGKELVKEKRRKRQLLFLEQKKSRLLPEALLEEFDTVAQTPPKLSDKGEQQHEEKDKKKKKKKVSKSLQDSCKVVRVKDRSANTSMQKSAMAFIQARLYGPGSRRTTNAELLSLEKKRGLNQGAAVQFASKNWGADEKAKAEKYNKRFIQKQKLISS
ncbi:nucleolar protein 7 [Ictalurus punctatus]|uniref:Nucleolar protein 7 n=1 Tax=Ictalurus punctatus TaxID=7998 RepID=A0A2D0RB91_ICTPU|nr:nucleolar protein 7 [Ictalurus punctatus]